MKIDKINSLDFDKLYKIITSTQITDTQKTDFVLSNRAKIKQIMSEAINHKDFKALMKNRTIQKFRPLKNSYTKLGDKIILAKALNIPTSKVPEYIKNAIELIQEIDNINFLPITTIEMLKTYVYRHGTKDELIAFLDFELHKTNNILKCLYYNLEYYNGGIADYFIRPIHRMDNKTLIKIFKIINKNIKLSEKEGKITKAQSEKIARWALIQIYNIQNNSKLINAIKTFQTLK